MTGSEHVILDGVGRLDRQDPFFLDIDVSTARSNLKIDIPVSTVLTLDPAAYDDDETTSTTLYAGTITVRVGRRSAPPVRLEPGGNFKMPPTGTIYVSNAAQSGRRVRLYCLPLAYDLKFYQRYDAPTVSPATAFAISVGTAATLITASQPGRQSVMVKNNDASAALYIGFTSGVTIVTGMPVAAGEAIWLDHSTSPVYGIVAAGTLDARVIVEG